MREPADTPTVAPPRILLVEDHAEFANNIAELLRLEGFDVTWTADGDRALAMARRWHFDAAVLDLVLPGDLDGFGVCRAMRSDPNTERVVIIMLTAMADSPSRIAGLDGGADDYLVKPVSGRELAVRLRKLLGERRARMTEVREQRRAAIDQMAAAVGHEINNPLTSAMGRIDLLLLSPDVAPAVRKELVACQDCLVRIQRIVAGLDGGVEDKTVQYVGPVQMIDLKRSASR